MSDAKKFVYDAVARAMVELPGVPVMVVAIHDREDVEIGSNVPNEGIRRILAAVRKVLNDPNSETVALDPPAAAVATPAPSPQTPETTDK
jgi:hypothetical protein